MLANFREKIFGRNMKIYESFEAFFGGFAKLDFLGSAPALAIDN